MISVSPPFLDPKVAQFLDTHSDTTLVLPIPAFLLPFHFPSDGRTASPPTFRSPSRVAFQFVSNALHKERVLSQDHYNADMFFSDADR